MSVTVLSKNEKALNRNATALNKNEKAPSTSETGLSSSGSVRNTTVTEVRKIDRLNMTADCYSNEQEARKTG